MRKHSVFSMNFEWHHYDVIKMDVASHLCHYRGNLRLLIAKASAIELSDLWQRGTPPRSPSEELRVVLMRSVKTTKELLLAEVTRPEKPAEHSNFTNKKI